MVAPSMIFRVASGIVRAESDIAYWSARLRDVFGLDVRTDGGTANPQILYRQLWLSLAQVPPALIKDCGVRNVLFRSDMGPNKPYYPNHGYYVGDRVGLNVNCFMQPDRPEDFSDPHGYSVGRAAQTAIHEFGHGYDYWHGDLCRKPEWLRLSGWSETPKPGLKRLIIDDPGAPKVVGEWFYDPKAGFTRFYAKRNPWDDWADSFAFWVAGLKDKLPKDKTVYFDRLLGKYYRK